MAEIQKDDRKALDQVFDFLKAKDDTSRFVGLSLLRTILDSNEELRDDENTIKQCWSAVPNKFLIRLLKPPVDDTKAAESKNMNGLAVAVIHTFANLLPSGEVSDKKMRELIETIAKATATLEAAPQMLAFQALQLMSSSEAGAHVFARAPCHGELAEPTESDDGRYLREYFKLYDIAWAAAHDGDLKSYLFKQFSNVISSSGNDNVKLETLAALSSQLTITHDLRALNLMITLVQNAIIMKPTAQARTAATVLASKIIQHTTSDRDLVNRLFNGPPKNANGADKPFAYIFTQYILIDIRSTIPTLMPLLAAPTYQTTSLRIAACFDVVAGFVTYLLGAMEEDEDVAPSLMPPDLLLKMRRDLSETFSLTLEFFRDRWDAVTTGAAGLDPSARTDPKAPTMLTWDNPAVPPEEDPIVLSGLRAMSLWLREDDNSDLNTQAIGVADILAALYEGSMISDAKVDFRPPIRALLEALLTNSDEAVQLLLDNKGWEMLAKDLANAVQTFQDQAMRDIVRVLLAVVNSDIVPQSREAWMDTIITAACMGTGGANIETLEACAEVYQLADAIYGKAPKKLQKEYERHVREIARLCDELVERLRGTDVDEGLVDSFAEIADSLRG